jgi:HicB_like antitoxin of bacterial toxin-antitoxin system
MTFTVIVYKAEEGGYWADVPELPGCGSQGETIDELETNIVEAIELACRRNWKTRARPSRDTSPPGTYASRPATTSFQHKGELSYYPWLLPISAPFR